MHFGHSKILWGSCHMCNEGNRKTWNLNPSDDMICLQLLWNLGDGEWILRLSWRVWIICVLNDLGFQIQIITSNWDRDEVHKRSLTLQCTGRLWARATDGTREKKLQCARVEGSGEPASSRRTIFDLGRSVFLFHSLGCIEKNVGSGWGAITEVCLRPDLAMGWIQLCHLWGRKWNEIIKPKKKTKTIQN